MTNASKVFVLGIDAADKDLIRAWSESGVLPNFRTLFEESAWSLTANPPMLESGSAWPSFYTGVWPGQHGQYDGLHHLVPGTYRAGDFAPSELEWRPFWEALSEAKQRVAVIDAPYTYVSEKINGIQIIDWGTHAPTYTDGARTFPEDLSQEIEREFGRDVIGACDAHRPRNASEHTSFRDKLLDRITRKEKLSNYILDQGNWDLFLTTFSECHCVGHQCWHLHDPSHPDHDPSLIDAVGNPVKDIYIAMDEVIGRFLTRLSPDVRVFVFASHGMGPNYSGTGLLDQLLLRLDGHKRQSRLVGARELLRKSWVRSPQVLRSMLMPLREKIWPAVDHALILPNVADRSYFEIYVNDATGGVRINLNGREPDGRVQPGAEYDRLCQQLTTDLMAVRNSVTGEPLARAIRRPEQLYTGSRVADLPDLLVQWNRDAPITEVESPKTGTLLHKYQSGRTGDHRPEGLLFARGSWVKPGMIGTTALPVINLAPTIAALLGVSLSGIEGSPVPELSNAEQLMN